MPVSFSGPEFIVNQNTAATQDDSTVIALAGGGFAVCFRDDSGGTTDATMRVFGANGVAIGGDIRLDVVPVGQISTPGVQNVPDLCQLGNGNIAAVWSSGGLLNFSLFSATGTRVVPVTQISGLTVSVTGQPAITALNDGRFVVACAISTTEIGFQAFNADGSLSGGVVSIDTGSAMQRPDLLALADGGFAVSWDELNGSDADAFFRIYNADGTARTAAILATDAGTLGGQQATTITQLADGRILLAWQSNGGSVGVIQARMVNLDGSFASMVFQLDPSLTIDDQMAAVQSLSDGRFIAVFYGQTSANGVDIHAQVFKADGSRDGTSFVVNTSVTNTQRQPSIAELADGRVIVTWTDGIAAEHGDGSNNGIRAQVIDVRGGSTGGGPLVGTSGNDTMVGASSDDDISARRGNDTITGGAGDDTINGGSGTDTAVFTGNRNQYQIIRLADGTTQVTDLRAGNPDGVDILTSIERLQFANKNIENPAYWASLEQLKYGGILFGARPNVGPGVDATLAIVDGRFTVIYQNISSSDGGNLLSEYPSVPITGSSSGASSGPLSVTLAGIQSDPDYEDGILAYVSGNGVPGEVFVRLNGQDFSVSGPTATGASDPDVALLSGRFMVTWREGAKLFMRYFELDGQPVGAKTQVDDFAEGAPVAVSLPGTVDTEGLSHHVIGFTTSAFGTRDVRIKVYDGLYGTYDLSSTTAGDQFDVTMAALSSGNVAAAWCDDSSGHTQIIGRILGGNGLPVSNEFRIDSDLTFDDAKPQICATSDGGFAAVWMSGSGAQTTIRARFFSAGGNPESDEFRVKTLAGEVIEDARIQCLPDGRLAVAWTYEAVAGSLFGPRIHVQLFDPRTGSTNLIGGNERDVFVGTPFDDTITGRFGDDQLTGGRGADFIYGGYGKDRLEGSSGDDELHGDEGDDTLSGGPGADALFGGEGNDTLHAFDQLTNEKADYLEGGAGDDLYQQVTADDIVVENPGGGIDTMTASFSLDLEQFGNIENAMIFGALSLNLYGNSDANKLTGNDGNNIIDGRGGDDVMLGGKGSDSYFVDSAGDVVIDVFDSLLTTNSVTTSSVSLDCTNFENIHDFYLTGSLDLDIINIFGDARVFGNDGDNIFNGHYSVAEGGKGDDTYFIVSFDNPAITEEAGAGGGLDLIVFNYIFGDLDLNNYANVENVTLQTTIVGTGIFGNELDNELTAHNGDDIIDGRGGNDTMLGLSGDDTYVIDSVQDVVVELVGKGTDTLQSAVLSLDLGVAAYANIENATLTGNLNLNITGNGDSNVLNGNDGNNALDGGAGVDFMSGGDGNDVFTLDSAGDIVTEALTGGADTVRSSVISLSLVNYANVENATLTGSGNLNLSGSSAANVLIGNAGINNILGRTGADTLTGGGGADIFDYNSTSESTSAAGDTITDFLAGTDRIDLSTIDANAGGGTANDVFTYIGNASFATAGQVRWFKDTVNKVTVVEANTGGTLAPELVIKLTGLITLSVADFVL